MSRRIRAEYTVTEGSFLSSRPQAAPERADAVAVGGYRIDVEPHPAGQSYTLSLHGKHWPQQLPLGALLPIRVDNLLPACKNIGATHERLLPAAPQRMVDRRGRGPLGGLLTWTISICNGAWNGVGQPDWRRALQTEVGARGLLHDGRTAYRPWFYQLVGRRNARISYPSLSVRIRRARRKLGRRSSRTVGSSLPSTSNEFGPLP